MSHSRPRSDPPATRLIAYVLIAAMLVSCATPRVINSPDSRQIASSVKVRDKVHIVTYDGSVFDFQVTEVRADSLSGRNHDKTYQVAFDQIQELQVTGAGLRRFSALQKIGIAMVAILQAAVLLAIVAWLGRSCSGGC